MKMKKVSFWMATVFCSLLTFALACSDDDPDPDNTGVFQETTYNDEVIAAYVDRTVVPTYLDMKNKVTVLESAVNTFYTGGSQTQLNAACSAWREARIPWEESEAFLYGPAEYEGLDPSLDDWPLEMSQINQILQSQDFSQLEGVEESNTGIKGFHTLEYLLFEDGQPRNIDGITDNHKKYMSVVAQNLREDTEALYKAWTEGSGTTEVPISFGEEFKKHNTTRFSSQAKVIGQIIDGCQTIANEVGDAKIGDPYSKYQTNKEEGVLAVESWYSWNSLKDYTDNIVSIENSYLGGRAGNRGANLSKVIEELDPAANKRVLDAIKNAKEKINKIPAPFRSNLDKTTEIFAAQEACTELDNALGALKVVLKID